MSKTVFSDWLTKRKGKIQTCCLSMKTSKVVSEIRRPYSFCIFAYLSHYPLIKICIHTRTSVFITPLIYIHTCLWVCNNLPVSWFINRIYTLLFLIENGSLSPLKLQTLFITDRTTYFIMRY